MTALTYYHYFCYSLYYYIVIHLQVLTVLPVAVFKDTLAFEGLILISCLTGIGISLTSWSNTRLITSLLLLNIIIFRVYLGACI